MSSLILAQHTHTLTRSCSLLLTLAHSCSLLLTLVHSCTLSPSPRSRATELAPGRVPHLLVLHWPQAQLSESKHLTFPSKPAHLPGLAALLVHGPAILSTQGKRLSHSCLLLLRHPHESSCICPFPPALLPQLLAKLLPGLLPSLHSQSSRLLLFPFQSPPHCYIFKTQQILPSGQKQSLHPHHTASLAWHPTFLHTVVKMCIWDLCLLLEHKFLSGWVPSSLPSSRYSIHTWRNEWISRLSGLQAYLDLLSEIKMPSSDYFRIKGSFRTVMQNPPKYLKIFRSVDALP